MARRLCGAVLLMIGCLLLTGCPPADQGDVGFLGGPASTSAWNVPGSTAGWGMPGSTASGWGMPGSTASGWGAPEGSSRGWATPQVTESSGFLPMGTPASVDAAALPGEAIRTPGGE